MSWRDRDYNHTGAPPGGFSLNSPLAILNYSLPLGSPFGIRIRLHFWLLLFLAFQAMQMFQTDQPAQILILMFVTVTALLWHEMGHRIGAQFVGGRHDDFLIWPWGNMIPPIHPPGAWPMFIAQAGGMIANLAAALVTGSLLSANWHFSVPLLLNPLAIFSTTTPFRPSLGAPGSFVYLFYWANLTLVYINLLPYYWFDGAYLVQAILWPMTGAYQAINVTCIVGMVLAVPMGLLALQAGNILFLIMWAMLFYGCVQRRRQLQQDGPSILEQLLFTGASMRDVPREKRQKLTRRWLHWTGRKNRMDRLEMKKLDQILEKVHEKGMHSLTWFEKRALRRATERQRDQELASRR